MELETKRLLLRPWQESDAAALYRSASDPRIGSAAGWEPHTSEAHSLEIIRTVLSAPETYAVVPKDGTEPVGAVGLKRGEQSPVSGSDEAELGCWIAAPCWGKGYAGEALDCLMTRAFKELGCSALWYGHYEDNEPSRRVAEKLGFFPHHARRETPLFETDCLRKVYFSRLTKAEWDRRPAAPLRFKDAELEDYDAALSLIRQLWTYNTYDREELFPVYRRVLEEKDSFAFFLLDVEDNILGFCHGAFFPTFWLSGETCYVSSVITVPEVRGSGCGRRLLDHVKELARARNCKGLVLDSGFPRTEAHRFYEKYGFEKSCYGFDLYL